MFFLHEDGFIGDTNRASSILWRGGRDLEDVFTRNIKKFPELSYFLNNQITYTFNTHGHRCNELQDLDLNNYILFIGCSHTEGVGLHITDSFPHIVSHSLKTDYYNLGIRASGIDVQLHNLTTWMLRVKTPPKLLVWQWTLEPRITVKLNTGEYEGLGSWSTEEEHLDFLMAANAVGYSKTKREFASSIISNLPFPTIQIDVNISPNTIYYRKTDFARDLLHFGPKSNKLISDTLINAINNKYKIG